MCIMAQKPLHTIFTIVVLGSGDITSVGDVAQKQNIVKCFCRQDGDDIKGS